MAMPADEIDAFMSETRVAVLSSVDARGRPRQAAIWFHWEDGAAYMFTGRGTLKWRNLQRDPRASLCVDDRRPPYSGVVLEGEVEESDRPLYDLVLGMALRYYGEERGRPFAEQYRDNPRAVAFKLTPRRVVSWSSDTY